MYNGINPTKSTDKNRTSLGEGEGMIPIGLDQRPAGHPRFPQSPGPPPSGPLPDLPTSPAKTTPEKAQYPTCIEGPVGEIIKLPFCRVEGDAKTLTNLDYSGLKGEFDEITQQPYKTAVKVVLKAMEKYKLEEEEEENKLLTHMKWKFRCEKCKKTSPAEEFTSCSRRFWKDELQKDVDLHGDECIPCFEENMLKKFNKLKDQCQSSYSVPGGSRGRA
ncbi:hypothetical protein H633G_02824 [Metarhizium anisopliae BRIP 53284]|nr:hypothetical protein H633G_02824 [Metarhizium anisopliae BRIP 53284]